MECLSTQPQSTTHAWLSQEWRKDTGGAETLSDPPVSFFSLLFTVPAGHCEEGQLRNSPAIPPLKDDSMESKVKDPLS